MESKIFLSNGRFFCTRCLLIELALKTMLARVSERENFFAKIADFAKIAKIVIQWTRRIQFRQPCRNIFNQRPKIFRSKCEYDKKRYFFKKKYFHSKCSCGHVESSFGNPAEKFSTVGQKFLPSISENVKNYFFQKINFPQNVPMDTQNPVLTNLLKVFRQKVKVSVQF